MTGTLYLCATPIGNLDDMTFRAVETLRNVTVVAAEDTRHSRKLLTHFDIHTELVRYDENNKGIAGPLLIERLLAGDSVAVVSDAGMPGISDPGSDLVKLAVQCAVPIVPLPGANAALCALVTSGLDTTTFTFLGFLPKTKKKQQEVLQAVVSSSHTLLFYEAPHRLLETLKLLRELLGDRQMAVGRELTKKFEEFVRGSFSEAIAHFEANPPRGEFTLAVAGAQAVPREIEDLPDAEQLAILVQDVMKSKNLDKKAAMREVADRYQVSRRNVYQVLLTLSEK